MLLPLAAAVDALCVLVFALVGRSSHGEAVDLVDVLSTAWPFLVGVLVGLAASVARREPLSTRTGVVVWLCAVTGGVALRLLSGAGAQPAFVVVATLTLGILLVGWRVLARMARRASTVQSGTGPGG